MTSPLPPTHTKRTIIYNALFYGILVVIVSAICGIMLMTVFQAITNDAPPTWRTVCTEREDEPHNEALSIAMGIPGLYQGACLRYEQVCKAGPAYDGDVICTDPKPTQAPS